MPRRRLPHGRSLLALAALLVALLLTACGGDDASDGGDDGPDPATVAPAASFLYGEALVRPTGDVEAGVSAALRTTLRVEDPGAEIRRLIDRAFAERGTDLTFAEDVEPWLGERAGGFLLLPPGDSAEDPDGAIALAVTDRGALEDLIERERTAGEQEVAGRYGGVEYDVELPDRDTYSALVGDLYVSGTLAGLRAAIDASRGDSLADSARYEDAVDELDDDALAFLYVDPREAARQLGDVSEAPPQARRALDRLDDAEPVLASVTATAEEIVFEATADQALADAAGADLDGSSDAEVTVGQLPGDAWLALATPPIGPMVRQALEAAGISGEAAQQVRGAFGLDLERDLLATIGGLGLFARGGSVLDIGGGALLQLTDERAAQRLMTRIQALVGAGLGVPPRSLELGGASGFEVRLPQAPQPIVVLQRGDRIAAGYAASSARDLLDPQERFEDSADGGAAIDTLGEGFEPSFVLIVPPVADLLRSLDQLQVAELTDVVSYLGAYRSLAVGTERDGDETTVRAVAALR